MQGYFRTFSEATVIEFVDRDFLDAVPSRRGPLAWRPVPGRELQEVLYYDRESPDRKYGVGLLHPVSTPAAAPPPEEVAVQATDTIGVETEPDDAPNADESLDEAGASAGGSDTSDDFEVTSPDVRHPRGGLHTVEEPARWRKRYESTLCRLWGAGVRLPADMEAGWRENRHRDGWSGS